MLTFIYPDIINFVGLAEEYARVLHTTPKDNYVQIPASYGTGYVYANKINDDMSFIAMDYIFKEDYYMLREPCPEFGLLIFFNQIQVSEYMKVKVDDEEMILKKQMRNSIYLSTAQQKLEMWISKNSHVKRIGIYFGPKVIETFLKKDMIMSISLYAERGLKNAHNHTINFELQRLLDEAFNTRQMDVLGRLVLQNRILLLAEKFFNTFFANVGKNSTVSPDDLDRIKIVEKILTEEELDEFPSVERLSKMAMMSATKLKSRFKEVYGMKLYEYYNHHRLLKARELILTKRITVKDAAYTIGFANISNFSRAFKKEFGVFPGTLRKRPAVF